MTFLNRTYRWLTKYKIHHLLFWAVYHFTWWSTYEGGAVKVFSNMAYPPYLIKFLFFVVFQAIGVYFCLYYLIPRVLEKGRYLIFVFSVIATILAMSLVISGGYLIGVNFYNFGDSKATTLFEFLKWHAAPSSLGSMTLGMSIKLTKNWMASQKRQQILEKEKLETELKFLRSQFNPHFLFNTINSVFVLINKDTNKATDSLAKFSELLRYQLYECNEPQIPLDRELSYLQSYMELEKIRQDENFELKTEFLDSTTGNLAIAPFLLMPFVENAFKHVSQNNDGTNWIALNLGLVENQFIFDISNSNSTTRETSRDAVDYGGLGLKNVQRRLELLYPNDHELILEHTDDRYRVVLKLNLKEYNISQIKQPIS